MAETHWEKTNVLPEKRAALLKRNGRWKFMVIGVALLGVVAYLIFNTAGSRYYVTVEELLNDPDMLGKPARVSGAVMGDVDDTTGDLHFTVVHIPKHNDEIAAQGGLGNVINAAISNPNPTSLRVIARDMERPDLLEHGNQAIVEGELVLENGEYIFYADSIKLKCPSKYEEQEAQVRN
ncbi:MAG: cytochrome c maturation protein CcmE [Chloroflexi bacterium]|nr:cytochrome c maturation protein CcmE [Chloroflexota bacterium]